MLSNRDKIRISLIAEREKEIEKLKEEICKIEERIEELEEDNKIARSRLGTN